MAGGVSGGVRVVGSAEGGGEGSVSVMSTTMDEVSASTCVGGADLATATRWDSGVTAPNGVGPGPAGGAGRGVGDGPGVGAATVQSDVSVVKSSSSGGWRTKNRTLSIGTGFSVASLLVPVDHQFMVLFTSSFAFFCLTGSGSTLDTGSYS